MHTSIQTALNQHGYAFHYRVLREIEVVASQRGGTSWRLVGIEVPVAIGGHNTRIDFVLEIDRDPAESRVLVAECKRVNPAYAVWCFAKAPYATPYWSRHQVVVESIVRLEASSAVSAGVGTQASDECYQIAFSLKIDKAGDHQPVANDKDAIEAACSQALKGSNGLADLLLHHESLSSLMASQKVIQIFPVVFTTAELWVTSVNLALADLTTGNVAVRENDVRKVDWLYYHYLQSPLLRHRIKTGSLSNDRFDDLLAREFIRTVAVVTPAGIPSFFETGWLQIARTAVAPPPTSEGQ